jgi:hypothetical protein
VRIAEHDPRAHADQLVDEEHARLEHLLVHHHHAVALGRGDDRDRHHVGRERRPGLVADGRHVAAEVRLHHAPLLGRDHQVRAVDAALDAEPLEAHERGAQVLDAGLLDAQLRVRHRARPMNEPTSMWSGRCDARRRRATRRRGW